MTEETTLERPTDRLPMRSLLALATAVFVTSLTETLPAGLLPAIGAGLSVGEPAAGQIITIYAVGTAVTTVPLVAVTATWQRKRLLILSIVGFAVANSVTALSSNYSLTMAARFVAGMAAGLAWALLAGYARRLVPEHLHGRALAVAMAGIPIALSLGVPAGTFLGEQAGWRAAFWVMTVIAVVLIGWIALWVPDFAGRSRQERTSLARTVRVPGVASVLVVTLTFVLAHTILYTYIAAFVDSVGNGSVGVALLVFGAACLVSIWMMGAMIDRWLRTLAIASVTLFVLGVGAMALFGGSTPLFYVGLGLWGLAWGGAPTLLQTAVGIAGGRAADEAQAMLVTLWNAAMALGGIIGGILLGGLGPLWLAWAAMILMIPTAAVVGTARRHGFARSKG